MRRRIALALTLAAFLAAAAAAVAYYLGGGRDGAARLVLHGNVDRRQLALAFEETGRIARLEVEEGDTVHPGDLVGVLETDRLEASLEAARERAAAAAESLRRLENGTRPQELERARARVASAEARLRQATRTHDRVAGVVDEGATTPREVDEARAARDMARAELEVARQSLELARIGPRDEDIAEARAVRDARRAEVELLERRLADTRLLAPREGVIENRLLEPGETAGPSRPVVTLAPADPKWIRAWVAEPDLHRVRPGLAARVSVDGLPGRRFTGRVGFISPVAEFTPESVETEEVRTSLVYQVRVLVDDPGNLLRLGMPATVEVVSGADDGPPEDTERSREDGASGDASPGEPAGRGEDGTGAAEGDVEGDTGGTEGGDAR